VKSKLLFICSAFFIFSACQKDDSFNSSSSSPSNSDTNSSAPTSIVSQWQSGTKLLDLSRLTLNLEVSADLMLTCTGSFGNSGQVNGMIPGDVELAGTSTAGYLFVGHLKYYGATDTTCSDMSKEVYSYNVTGNTLTFCALNWDVCGTYTLVTP